MFGGWGACLPPLGFLHSRSRQHHRYMARKLRHSSALHLSAGQAQTTHSKSYESGWCYERHLRLAGAPHKVFGFFTGYDLQVAVALFRTVYLYQSPKSPHHSPEAQQCDSYTHYFKKKFGWHAFLRSWAEWLSPRRVDVVARWRSGLLPAGIRTCRQSNTPGDATIVLSAGQPTSLPVRLVTKNSLRQP